MARSGLFSFLELNLKLGLKVHKICVATIETVCLLFVCRSSFVHKQFKGLINYRYITVGN